VQKKEEKDLFPTNASPGVRATALNFNELGERLRFHPVQGEMKT